ncbi:TetR/AcrR family transcriptional regulator [Geosporobacter ferrireducens]|uniref:TetR/AcrR family transcriptional regulator n=1 Tax=Geosporobacter ferrireducens TaxID=1424294 RepID=UPI00139EF848|nr:TetR/AcrR family transcriptional regulator [Geosporobacter ferrireducens]MTI56254.1 TetR/AcrR family transcriptional regulator [Geosporobacter ferrireducens]
MANNTIFRRRGDQLQSAIYEVTYRLLTTEGFNSINFARIAREAKTSRSVIYRYWETTFDLVFDTVHNRFQELEDESQKTIFDKGNLRDNLLLIGQMFMKKLNSFPMEFNRMVLYEMQNCPKRIKEMLTDARKSNLQMIDHILLIAIEKKEITKMPIEETKLALFQLIRHAIILENEPVSTKKLEALVDYIVLPAILRGAE